VLSSPHYAQSNGHAESAVKAMEALVIKVAPTGNIDIDKFQKALLEWRNTPRNHGLSPAQMVFGRPIRTQLPVHPHALRQCSPDEEQAAAEAAADQREKAARRYDDHAKPLPPLESGTAVRIQDPTTKLWDRAGTIVYVGRHRKYRVKQLNGRLLWRNRRFIREDHTLAATDPVLTAEPPVSSDPAGPRRSSRAAVPKRPWSP